jgi:hypothetical protein
MEVAVCGLLLLMPTTRTVLGRTVRTTGSTKLGKCPTRKMNTGPFSRKVLQKSFYKASEWN